MRDVNRVEYRGRLARDAERIGPEERPGVKLLVLTNRSYEDRNGERVQEVTPWDTIIWGQSSPRFSDLRKGQAVHVVGRLHLHKWTDQSGAPREKLQVIVQDLEVLGPQPRQQLGDELDENPPEGV